jgi:hypothetical protein
MPSQFVRKILNWWPAILPALLVAGLAAMYGGYRYKYPHGYSQRGKFVGTWKLVSIEERDANGRLVTPLDFGPEPIGILVYDATGHMSVNMMRRGRPRLASDEQHLVTPEEAKAAFIGYVAYFGTYTIDEGAGLVIHDVEGSLVPNMEGSEQRRQFTISGDTLVLEPPAMRVGGEKHTRRVIWQRLTIGS